MKNDLGNFIKTIRAEKNLSLRELSTRTGISHSYLHILENGIDPRSGKPVAHSLPTLEKLAAGLDVSLDEIIKFAQVGYEISQTAGRVSRSSTAQYSDSTAKLDLAYDFKEENIRMLPILGTIAAGEPCYADNDIEGWFPVDMVFANIHKDDIDKYYYLRIKGNSMEPMFNDRDLVLIQQGPVDDGQIAAVLCSGEEACVKKIQLLKDQDILMLISRNPNYPPVTKHLDECRILGRVVLRMGEPRW